MMALPNYFGPMAFGLKMGVVTPGIDLEGEIFNLVKRCNEDGFLDNGDVVCVTESIVARAQGNYVSVDEVVEQIRHKMNLSERAELGVVFPIVSRNRFSMVLKSIARSTQEGMVAVQFSFPYDEVGNPIICPDFAEGLEKELITIEDIGDRGFKHPLTNIDYLKFYKEVIESEGATPEIFLCNDPAYIVNLDVEGAIAADIHNRKKTKEKIKERLENCITLDEICDKGEVYSEWGLLGSNMSSESLLKLAPREGYFFVESLQKRIRKDIGVETEVLIYGDGAYKDPSSGIYELADPLVVLAQTKGLNFLRKGFKYKYVADVYLNEKGKSREEVEKIIEEKRNSKRLEDLMEEEGTTPRKMGDLLGSLADLVSGSADVGTPVVLVKNFLR